MSGLRALVGYGLAPVALAAGLLSLRLPLALRVEPYADGVTPLYLDRPYVNDSADPALAGLRVVRLPRHLSSEIELELAAPARVLRLLSDEHETAPFAGWERVPGLRVDVPGRSCVLTYAVAKRLAPGSYRLPPGGSVASAPLLLEGEGEVRARSTASWNRLEAGQGVLEFVTGNGRKLAVLALAYAAWCAGFRRLSQRSSFG